MPKVFASYSHDSDEHKQWVLKLCTKLVENGVDVMLDQWDIRLGTDQTLFMEKLGAADRVLVICTDAYVEKADNRTGGVGYEGRIITAQIAENLKTDKFIPIIRQLSNQKKMPVFLGKSQYIDFTDDNRFDKKFNELLHDIHGVPIIPKPPLGENPLSNQASIPETPSHNLSEIPEKVESVTHAYESAFELVRVDDTVGWQQLVKRIRQNISNCFKEWKLEFEEQERDSTEKILETVNKAVDIVSPLLSVALAGVESEKIDFNDQKSVLHDLFTIVEWKDSSYITWMNMPDVLRYVYHSLHGGLCLRTNQLNLALSLARENVRVIYPKSQGRGMVWETPQLTIHYYFNASATDLWKYLVTAYERWEWLSPIFANDTEYRASLVAYYLALNIHELANHIASSTQIDLDNYDFKVRLNFLSEVYEINERAIDILLHNPRLSELWESLGVTQERMKHSWRKWIEKCRGGFGNTYQGYSRNSRIHPDYENFLDNL